MLITMLNKIILILQTNLLKKKATILITYIIEVSLLNFLSIRIMLLVLLIMQAVIIAALIITAPSLLKMVNPLKLLTIFKNYIVDMLLFVTNTYKLNIVQQNYVHLIT